MSSTSNNAPAVQLLAYAPVEEFTSRPLAIFLGCIAFLLGASRSVFYGLWSEDLTRWGSTGVGAANQLHHAWENLDRILLGCAAVVLAVGGVLVLRKSQAGFRILVIACKAQIAVEIVACLETASASISTHFHWAEISGGIRFPFGVVGIMVGSFYLFTLATCVPVSLIAIIEYWLRTDRSSRDHRWRPAVVVAVYIVILGVLATCGTAVVFKEWKAHISAMLATAQPTISWFDSLVHWLQLCFCSLADLFFAVGGLLWVTSGKWGRGVVIVAAWVFIISTLVDDAKDAAFIIANYFGAGPNRFGNGGDMFMTLKWLADYAASAIWAAAFPAITLVTLFVGAPKFPDRLGRRVRLRSPARNRQECLSHRGEGSTTNEDTN